MYAQKKFADFVFAQPNLFFLLLKFADTLRVVIIILNTCLLFIGLIWLSMAKTAWFRMDATVLYGFYHFCRLFGLGTDAIRN